MALMIVRAQGHAVTFLLYEDPASPPGSSLLFAARDNTPLPAQELCAMGVTLISYDLPTAICRIQSTLWSLIGALLLVILEGHSDGKNSGLSSRGTILIHEKILFAKPLQIPNCRGVERRLINFVTK